MIFIEFRDLNIDAEDWLYDRYSEIRKLSKAWLKMLPITDTQWLDPLVTLDQLIQNFTNQIHQINKDLLLLCISDVLN
jgi:hypothetical protein